MTMSKQDGLLTRGYIFGLGAFRRYKELTGHDIAHFEEALQGSVDVIESNYRWAMMLKCANDVHVNIHGGDKLSVDEFTVLLDASPQADSDQLMQQYLDSNYLGKKLREYYGVPPVKDETKKKSSARAKPSS